MPDPIPHFSGPSPAPRKRGALKRLRYGLLDSWAFCALVRALVWLLGVLPRPLAHALGRAGGSLAYLFDRGHRELCDANLLIAFPEKSDCERRAILKACYRHLGLCAVDFCRMARQKREDLLDQLIVPDPGTLEIAPAVQAEGRGVICIAAHIGFWELLGASSKVLGFDLVSISRKIPSPRLEALVRSVRERFGNRMIEQEGALRAILRNLRENRGAGILVDLHAGRDSPWIPFFGKEASTYDSAARLHLRTGAPLVFGVTVRRPDGRYRLRIRRIDPGFLEGSDNLKVRQILVSINLELEAAIREYPEQWVWMHKRWRKKPS